MDNHSSLHCRSRLGLARVGTREFEESNRPFWQYDVRTQCCYGTILESSNMALMNVQRMRDGIRQFTRRQLAATAASALPVPTPPAIRTDLLSTLGGDLYASRPQSPEELRFPQNENCELLLSSLCRAEQLESPAFRYWARRLNEKWRLHRKLWEFCFICQALYERDLLIPDARGLGFAVGQEPLPSLFAAFGCHILATDLPDGDPGVTDWADGGQWAVGLESLNKRGLCDEKSFAEHVTFAGVNMNQIPKDLGGFDFTWSSCSFEHCGNLELGHRFLINQMQCLRPGGVAVHTTEFNLTSDEHTLSEGQTVIFRRRDIELMVRELKSSGHRVEPIDLSLGNHPLDRHVDVPPYSSDRHLRLHLGDWVTTSIGLIITKADA